LPVGDQVPVLGSMLVVVGSLKELRQVFPLIIGDRT
jgi:hypothetical protein